MFLYHMLLLHYIFSECFLKIFLLYLFICIHLSLTKSLCLVNLETTTVVDT